MTSTQKEWQVIPDKQVSELFDIITGSLYFSKRPFTTEETSPDLVLKWKIPDEKFIEKSKFQGVSSYVSVPSVELERAFELAQKKITYESNKNNQQDNKEVQFRLIDSFEEKNQGVKIERKIKNIVGSDEELEFMCYDYKKKQLDGFSLHLNSILYLLQRVCGFNVRTFIIHSQERDENQFLPNPLQMLSSKKKVKSVYIFLSLNVENMLKVAGRYEIKKEVQYSTIDLFLNDPSTEDNRPIKYHSKVKEDPGRLQETKHLSRFFNYTEPFDINTPVLDEMALDLLQEQKFESYWEQVQLVLNFFRNRVLMQTKNQEKIYLYQYNRGKLNPGCQKELALVKKRREYYEIMKDVCQKYGYPFHDEFVFCSGFVLPTKQSKGGFFGKLRKMLLYKPYYVSPYGDMNLFLSMQRTKLCYLMMKSTFKMSRLEKMGFTIFALNNQFEKTGEGGENQLVRGGLGGVYLTMRFYVFALFSDIHTLRSYYGDKVAHELMIRISIIGYLLSIAPVYVVLYIVEQLYTTRVYLYTTMFQTGIFAITFSIFTHFINKREEYFISNYSDKRHSTIFINEYRGPYIRNVVTDELNQFQEERGFWRFLKNLVILIIFMILVVLFGSIFFGCRMLLLEIQGPLYRYQTQYVSLSHILSYSIYFLLGELFKRKFYGKVVELMLIVKNPSSDESEGNMRSFFTFYYLLVLQVIPIFFFFILEPFQKTSCYSVSCDEEFFNYIYARFLFNLAFVFIGFIYVGVVNWLKNQLLGENKPATTFTDRMARMLKLAVEESQKKPYDEGLTQDILAIFAYSFYCSQLAISGVIALGTIAAVYVAARISLFYRYRRPINRSQPIISFIPSCLAIYFVGLLINIWMNTFLFNYVETYYLFIIDLAPKPLTEETIFLIKLVFTAIFFIVISILGFIGQKSAQALSPQTLIQRQRQKYKQYEMKVSGPKTAQNKIEVCNPLKTIFRTFNPEVLRPEIEQDLPQEYVQGDNINIDDPKEGLTKTQKGQPENINTSNNRLVNQNI